LLKIGQSEIYNFDVPFFVNEYVFWFQVAVYHTVLVHELNGEQKLSGIELRSLWRKALGLPNLEKQVTTLDILHDEVEGVLLEYVAKEADDEWTALQHLHDLQLLLQIFLVIVFLLAGLVAIHVPQHFECVNFSLGDCRFHEEY